MKLPARTRALLAAITVSLASPDVALGTERSLEWRLLDAEGRLDSRGDLHVIERLVLVFTGDWNGGERVFDVEPGQHLTLERVARIDGAGGVTPMREGSLDRVDHWAWVRGSSGPTLRWRSRAPNDPPFDRTEIAYVLQYVLSGVLVDSGDGTYRLAHDFAFPNRAGTIREVRARLDVDPSWQPADPLSLALRELPPGEGAVVRVSLRWAGAGAAPGVTTAGARPNLDPLPFLLAGAMLAALALAVRWVWRHDRDRGLFAPLRERIDDAWIREHVLAHPPEVIGAAWIDYPANAISALLARLAMQRKLETRLERRIGRRDVLHLRLLVDRGTLSGPERLLVDGLFPDGETTDTRTLLRRRGKTGIDPTGAAWSDLREKGGRVVPRASRLVGWPWWLVVSGLFMAVLPIGVLGVARGADPDEVFGLGFIGLLVFAASGLAAALLARAVTGLVPRAVVTALPLVAWAAGIVWAAWRGAVSDWTVAAQTTFWGGAVLVVAVVARTPLGATGILVRRRLAAVRREFALELQRRNPHLQDDWIPYLVALDLGRGLDRWNRVYGPQPAVVAPFVGTPSGSGVAPWTGGGGCFAGAGASGSWAAMSSVSATVSGAAGAATSGGGGGGGW